MSYENVIFDGYAFADERVAGNLAVFADPGAFLYLYKVTDFCVITDGAAVKVDKVVNVDAFAEFYIWGDLFQFKIYFTAEARSALSFLFSHPG